MAGRTDVPWWQRERVRTAHQRTWSTIVGTVVAAGGLAFVLQLGWAAALVGLVLGTVTIGSCALAMRIDGPPELLAALRTGALVTCVLLAVSGLVQAVGPVGYVVLPLVAGTWPGLPPLVARGVRWVRDRRGTSRPDLPDRGSTEALPVPGTIDMSAFEAAMLDGDPADEVTSSDPGPASLSRVPTDELCRTWRRTYVLLAQDLPAEMALHLVRVRDECLEELRLRDPGAYRRLVESGATPAGDLRRFFSGRDDSVDSRESRDSGDTGDNGTTRHR